MTNAKPPKARKRRSTRTVGGWLVAGAFLLTVALAFIPTGEGWGITVGVILVLVAGGLQFGGAFMFDKAGRADPSLANAAVGRLLLLTSQARRARVRAENAFATETGTKLRSSVGQLSVELSYLEEGMSASAQDWALFHPDAIARLAEEDQKQEPEEPS
ncbi:hypothetical protein [Microbacterium ulmi]|uniref:Uncharacterized protein n=1 Tax=Microbacterium ulmi TaxID=179095 RepID=A0A7Y2M0K6_9MICO|nr:hypothetical protein [Microbacterium ulmi]NII71004.1 hypothetical protein [Microbacterium ulmi]NNH04229.1 hypothetical protein [Microbacterium ulmi]